MIILTKRGTAFLVFFTIGNLEFILTKETTVNVELEKSRRNESPLTELNFFLI